jgi:hypothetical protein
MMNQPVTTRAALLPSPVGRRAGDEGAQLAHDLEQTIAGNVAEILEA